jgi:hypothetical protein
MDDGVRRRWLLWLAAVVAFGLVYWVAFSRPFPPDTTPEGAYLRIAKNVSEDHPRDVFAYLETDAQWASYTILEMRKKAVAHLRKSYPKAAAEPLLAEYAPAGDAPDGADVFAQLATSRGWIARLRKDLSGIARVETEGTRASVVTVRGTRYPFRRRDNGIWGATLFTAELVAEAERATRDLAVVEAAAQDYERAAP